MATPILASAMVVAGLACLVRGSDLFVDGAVSTARHLGVSEHLIGLTLVAFATSLPELAASMAAGITGHDQVILGNIVGSNVANIGLVLGTAAVIRTMVPVGEAKKDCRIMMVCTLLFIILSLDAVFDLIDALIFLVFFAIYVFHLYRSEHPLPGIAKEERVLSPTASFLFAVLGASGVIFGAHFLIKGAIDIAEALGVSSLTIGLTLVAVGTSLPELATAVVAALKGRRDIAVGTIIGSNIINLLFIFGVAGLLMPIDVSSDFLIMRGSLLILITAFLWAFAHTKIGRIKGLFLLFLYVIFIAVL